MPASADSCVGFLPRLASMASAIGAELMLIALLGVEAVGDDHLRRRVDRRLRIVALDEAVLGFHDAAFGIGEVLLRFGVRLFGWRGGGLARFLAALGLSLLLGLGLRFGLGRSGRFRLGLQFGLRRPDLLGALLLVGDPFGQLLAALVAAEGSVFLGVRSLGCAQPPIDLGLELRRTLLHALVAHRLVLGGVRLDLRPVERDMAELHKSRLFAQLENLPEQSRKRLQVPLAEVGDGAKIRRIEPDNAHEVDPFARRLGDPARRVDAVTIAVQQQRRHHRRVKRRLPALARIRGFDLTKVEMLEHKRQNEPSQMVLADKVLHARRQQQRLIDRPGPEGLAHKQAESDSRKRRHQNPPFLGQAPSRLNRATLQMTGSRKELSDDL